MRQSLPLFLTGSALVDAAVKGGASIRRGQPHCSAVSQMSVSTSAATVKYGP